MSNLIGPTLYVTGLIVVTVGSLFLGRPEWLGAGAYPLAFLLAAFLNKWMSVMWPAASFRETRADYLDAIPVALYSLALNQFVFVTSTEHTAGWLGAWLFPASSSWIADSFEYAGTLVLCLLLYETIAYLQHRLEHRIGPLWRRVHSLHHEPRFFGFALILRVHHLEYLFTHLTRTLPLLLLQVDPTIITSVMSISVYGVIMGHTNTRLSFAPIAGVFATPDVHIWHHDQLLRVNYSVGTFTVFDRIAGTYFYPGSSVKPPALGIDGVETLRGGFDTLVLRPAHVTPAPQANNP